MPPLLEGRHIGRKPLDIDHQAILHDRVRGLSLGELAKLHHISRTTIARVLKDPVPKGVFPSPLQLNENRRRIRRPDLCQKVWVGKRKRNCKRKLKHLNYLSALLHATSLCDYRLVICPCSVCGGLHLGHQQAGLGRLTPRQTQERIAALRKRVRTHQRLAEDHKQFVEELARELVQLSSLVR